MVPEEHDEWPEHAVCARCAAPLGENYRLSPLGLRFCEECFDKTVQEKVRERAAKIYLQGHCANCGKSLINGYRLSQLGVLYCIPCYDNLSKTSEEKAEEHTDTDTVADTAGRRVSAGVAGGILWISLASAHLLLFISALSLASFKWRLSHPDSYFKGLVCLDFLTVLLLLASRRPAASPLPLLWTLLIASSFIILIGREVIGFVS